LHPEDVPRGDEELDAEQTGHRRPGRRMGSSYNLLPLGWSSFAADQDLGLASVLAGALVLACLIHRPGRTVSAHTKVHVHRHSTHRMLPHHWQLRLREALESLPAVAAVVALIAVDILCIVLAMLADTESGKEALEGRLLEVAETVGMGCLYAFLLEQGLHLAAFGQHFFQHRWFVADFCVVSFSLLAETTQSAVGNRWPRAFRVWRLLSLIFDVCLEEHEAVELEELYEKTHNTRGAKKRRAATPGSGRARSSSRGPIVQKRGGERTVESSKI